MSTAPDTPCDDQPSPSEAGEPIRSEADQPVRSEADGPVLAEDVAAMPVPTGKNCGNCGSPLFGEHCYHCGQPVEGLVRHFTSVIGDIADTFFEIDTRLTRTVAPLLLRPGYLSCEYFAGRRVRYVSPVRLFFFISVMAFFVAQWTAGNGGGAIHVDQDGIEDATTVAAVEQQLHIAVQGLQKGSAAAGSVPGVAKGLSEAEQEMRKEADQRIAELNKAKALGVPPPVHEEGKLMFGDGKPWDPKTNPLHFNSLPGFANTWLNGLAGQAQGNLQRIQQNPVLLLDAWLSAMPSTLFLLLPLFAALLKLTYLFKRRLYMEHFIVALHSHAFLCFSLLLVLILGGLQGVVAATWMHVVLGIVMAGLIVWMPLYLLLMQKRVYGQGWFTTVLKYLGIGLVYTILLSFGAAISLLVKLVWL